MYSNVIAHLFAITKHRFAKKQVPKHVHNAQFNFYIFHFSSDIQKGFHHIYECVSDSLIYYMMKMDKGIEKNLIT